MSEIINRLGRFKKISESDRAAALYEARSMFGGLSGEATELYEELEEDGESTEVPNIPPPTSPPQVEDPTESNADPIGEPAIDPIDEELSNSSNDP